MVRKVWIEALRPRTLPLAVASTGLGSFIAWHEGLDKTSIAVLTITTAILLQILSNLANDYGDFIHGADTEDRIGPSRAVSAGHISPTSMLIAIICCIVLCLASGISLLYISFGEFNYRLLGFFIGGLIAIAAAIKYTAGKNPYGYRAMGDLSVFLFFGIMGVMGTYYLHTHVFKSYILLPAAGFGLLSAAVLNLNNLRDYETDRNAGKITMVVKMGRDKGLIYHYFLIGTGWLFMLIYNSIYFFNTNTYYTSWLFVFLAPLYFLHLRKTKSLLETNPAGLTLQLRLLSLLNLMVVLFFGLGNLP